MNTLRTGLLMAALTGLFLAVGFAAGGGPGMAAALLFALATNAWAYWHSDKALLSMYGAREADARTAPGLVAQVALLAGRAGLPMPKVYVVEDAQPNAFATGRDPEHAAVCVTSGLLAQVSDEELAGVLAHELGHVQHRDTLIMTIAAAIAGAVSMNFGGGRRGNPLGLAGMVLAMLLAPIAAVLVQVAVSRAREFEADRAGAEISGRPLWLAAALENIAQAVEGNPASAHFHPATAERVARLRAMAWR